MKKTYAYNVMGDKKCSKCGCRLKKRIEIEHPNFVRCYRCYKGLPPVEVACTISK
jgi:hypothetical protein